MLRNLNDLENFKIRAADGEIGHISGFRVDEESWVIRYLVIDTSNWWGGRKVLIAPSWIKGVNWSEETVSVDVSRDSIKNAPPDDPTSDWDREQELKLYRHCDSDGEHASMQCCLYVSNHGAR